MSLLNHPCFRTSLSNLCRIPVVAPVPNRAVLSVDGSQASEFLNGVLASATHEPIKRPRFSTFLHAQGRVLYDVFLYTTTNPKGQTGYLIEYDPRPSEALPLLTLLKRYVLRSKVKIRDASDEYDVWAAWGTKQPSETPRKWAHAPSGAVEPVWTDELEWPWGTMDHRLNDRRAVGMGQRMLVQKGDRPRETSDHELASSKDYTLHRILRGVPEGGTDIPPMHAFPMESNLDMLGGLDFRKGCYVGQELTVRTYHTGVIRKRILPVLIHKPDDRSQKIDSSRSFPSDLDVRASVIQTPEDGAVSVRPRGTGKLLTSVEGFGLALLRLEHVERFRRGEIKLEFETTEGDEKTTWGLSPQWPEMAAPIFV